MPTPEKISAARAATTSARFTMKAIAEATGVSRSTLQAKPAAPQRPGRPPLPEGELLAEIWAVIAELPTYGYRCVHAILHRRAEVEERPSPNHKRVRRVMKAHGLLLARHAGGADRRPRPSGCALDCCDREAMSYLSTTGGMSGDDVRDLMVAAVENRFGRVSRLPQPIEWLSDNGSP